MTFAANVAPTIESRPIGRYDSGSIIFLFRLAVLLLLPLAGAKSAPPSAASPPLQSVAYARGAPIQEQGNPIRLHGTVTAFSGWKNSFFLQDSTGAISVDRQENASLRVGDEVELIGHTQRGLFANIFISDKTVALGHAAPPEPISVSYQDLQTGDYDSKFIEVNGIVHSVRKDELWGRQMLFVDLQIGAGAITIYLAGC